MVLISNSPRSQSWGLLFFCLCVFVRVGADFNYLTCLWVMYFICLCANKSCFWLRPPYHRGLSARLTQLEQESLKTQLAVGLALGKPPVFSRSKAYRALTPYFAEISPCSCLMWGRGERKMENILPQGSVGVGRSHWNRLLIIGSVVGDLFYSNLSCIFVKWFSHLFFFFPFSALSLQ